ALRDPAVNQIRPELGKRKNATTAKARPMLAWTPRSNEDAILPTPESRARLALLASGQRGLQPNAGAGPATNEPRSPRRPGEANRGGPPQAIHQASSPALDRM